MAESFLRSRPSDAGNGICVDDRGFNAAAALIALPAPGSPRGGRAAGPAAAGGGHSGYWDIGIPGYWDIGTPIPPGIITPSPRAGRNRQCHGGMQLIAFLLFITVNYVNKTQVRYSRFFFFLLFYT